MSIIAVARRYAEALADVAINAKKAEETDRELLILSELFARNQELRTMYASPIVKRKDKEAVLELLIARLKPGAITANLLRTLLQHHRLHNLDVIYREFRREMDRRQGIVQAEVTTASPLDNSQQNMLVAELQSITGKKINIEYKVDGSLIGGAVTRLGSVVYDGSIKTKLKAIQQQLKTAE